MIAGQGTLLARTMHDIRYDALHDEVVVPNQFGQALLTFRGNASGEEAPIRVINGPHTQLKRPDRLDIDPTHNEIIVPNADEIAVFSREANGDTAPIRVIKGPDTHYGAIAIPTLAVDPVNNVIVTVGRVGKEPALLIFNRTDQGNVAPQRMILGASSEQIQVYPPRGWIITTVNNGGGPRTEQLPSIRIYSIHDNGKVPARWVIGGPKSTMVRPRGVALIPSSKEIVVADMTLNSVLTYYFPEMF